MELDTIKFLLLAAFTCISFIVLSMKQKPLLLHGPTFGVLMGLLFITLHYYVVGFSLSETTNETILFAAALWTATFVAIAAFGPGYLIDTIFKTMSPIVYPVIAYLIYLLATGFGINDYGDFVGITENPNVMGAILALFLFPIALQNILNRSKKKLWLFFDIIAIVAVLYLIYLTRSRGAALAVGGSLAYISLISRNIGPAFKGATIIAILAAATLMQEFFLKYEGLGLGSTREYLVILRLEAIAERPWFGWGLAADVNNSFNSTNMFPPQEKGNTFLQFVEEFGLLFGVPLFLLILGLCIAISLRLTVHKEKIWITIFLISALTHSMVETWMLNFRSFFAIAFWVLLLFGGACSFGFKAELKSRFAYGARSHDAGRV